MPPYVTHSTRILLDCRCVPLALCVNVHLSVVGLSGFEPLTPALSAQCSNRLSYRPIPKHFNP